MRPLIVSYLFLGAVAWGQSVPALRPHPPLQPGAPAGEPKDPPAQTFTDPRSHAQFSLPAGWNLARRDGELSTFRLDARGVPRRFGLRGVADMAFNPFPYSTFSGALFYYSVAPGLDEAGCVAQATGKPRTALEPEVHGDMTFSRGHDEHGGICVESRDTVYTTVRQGSCLRFDLVINTFCGGEVSGGVRDMTETELRAVQQRLTAILDTVRFTGRSR